MIDNKQELKETQKRKQLVQEIINEINNQQQETLNANKLVKEISITQKEKQLLSCKEMKKYKVKTNNI